MREVVLTDPKSIRRHMENRTAGITLTRAEIIALLDRLEAAERALAAYPVLHPDSAEAEAELRREWERDHAPAIEAAKRELY